MVGGIVFPVGFFLLGWAPVAGKIVGLAFVGVAFLLIFQCVCRPLPQRGLACDLPLTH